MRVQRAQVDDMITREGRTAVLLGEKLVILSELASSVLALCDDLRDSSEIADALKATFGSPVGTSTRTATQAVVDQLLAQGLLIRLE